MPDYIHFEPQTILAMVMHWLGWRVSERERFNTRNLLMITVAWSSPKIQCLILTDIVVALSLSELLAQGEGGEALELLGEFFRGMGGEWPRALPTELVKGVRFAHLVVFLLHHVQHITLSCVRWYLAVGVVGADDVQIVVYTDFHCVLIPQKAAGRQKERGRGLLRCPHPE